LTATASPDRQEWAARFFGMIDAMNAPGFAAFFTEGGAFRMGNGPAAVGRPAIEEFVRGFFGAIQGIRHEKTGLWEAPATLFSEGDVFYTTHGGQVVTHPYLGVMEFDGDLIRECRIYVDPAPLMAAL
jgi:hypothetical protein